MHKIRLLLLAAASSAIAQPAHPPGPRMDLGSVYISLMGQPFRERDRGQKPFERWFNQADENGDGAISRIEFRHDAEAFFDELDVNHDKQIDSDEIDRYEKVVAPAYLRAIGSGMTGNASFAPKRGAPPAAGDSGQVPIVPDGMAPSASRIPKGLGQPIDFANVPQPVAMADMNFDRRVTPDEFIRTASRRFTNYDQDQDGRLTVRELGPSMPAYR